MSTPAEVGLFVAGLALSLQASAVLASCVDKLGQRLELTDPVIGILTALAANAPEISSAVVAVAHHQRAVGFGVILGSNTFNVAALLGLPAVVAGRVRIGRHAVLLAGGVAFAVSAVGAVLVLGGFGPAAAAAVALVVTAVYVAVSTRRPHQLLRLHRDPATPPGPVLSWLAVAVAEEEHQVRGPARPRQATRDEMLAILPCLVTVVLGSTLMVDTATTLGRRWHVSAAVVGLLVLAVLTSLPNTLAAVRLAVLKRGSATVAEGLNSNVINIVAGLCLPALVVGVGGADPATVLSAGWLLGLTALALAFALRGGLRRRDGILLIAGYVVFVGLVAGGAV